jgi:hypothetical protein
MLLPWKHDRCILCLDSATFTEEHVIPKAIGGILKVPFLCESCNSDLGTRVEAETKKDPSIRLALEQIRSLAPELIAKLTERQEFIAESPRGKVRGFLRNGKFRVHAKKQFDGSVILPIQRGWKYIKKHLQKTGAGQQEIDQTLRQLDTAPENTFIPIDAELQMIKWSVGSLQPALDGNFLSDQVVLKIAYEFVACILGSQVYTDIPVLSAARRTLHDQLDPGAILRIERLHASKYDAFHGLAFEGNKPHTVIQVRLFGWLAFRIHFHGLAINAPRTVYTHRLDTNKDDWCAADKS